MRCAENEVAFEIQGEGKIIGLDNGNPASHDGFKGNRKKAFNGQCLAIVQSTAKSGRIQLTATSPGSNPAASLSRRRHNRNRGGGRKAAQSVRRTHGGCFLECGPKGPRGDSG